MAWTAQVSGQSHVDGQRERERGKRGKGKNNKTSIMTNRAKMN